MSASEADIVGASSETFGRFPSMTFLRIQGWVGAREWQMAGDQVEKDGSEGEEVRPLVERSFLGLLGTHEGGGAHERPGHRDLRLVEEPRDAEVHQLHGSIVADHDVVGLQVSMENSLLVGIGERFRDPCANDGHDLRGEAAIAVQQGGERLTIDELGDDVALARILTRVVEDLENVRVP